MDCRFDTLTFPRDARTTGTLIQAVRALMPTDDVQDVEGAIRPWLARANFPQGKGVWRDDAQGRQVLFDEPVVIQCYPSDQAIVRQAEKPREFLHCMGRESRQGAIGLVIDREYLEIGFPLEETPSPRRRGRNRGGKSHGEEYLVLNKCGRTGGQVRPGIGRSWRPTFALRPRAPTMEENTGTIGPVQEAHREISPSWPPPSPRSTSVRPITAGG